MGKHVVKKYHCLSVSYREAIGVMGGALSKQAGYELIPIPFLLGIRWCEINGVKIKVYYWQWWWLNW